MTTVAVPAETDPPTAATAPRARWSLRYTPGLDGLRGTGMLVMLSYHAEFTWAPGAFLLLSQFFTLSGFLVTSVLLQGIDKHGGVDLRRFWVRRVRRLWPASLAALAGIAVYGALVADASQAESLPRQVAAAAAHLANWQFIADDTSYVNLFAAPSPVQHYWSLSLEEQFYFLLPLGLVAVIRASPSRKVLAGALATVAAVCTAWMVLLSVRGAGVDRIYYGTDTRMPEILTGAILAVVMSRVRVQDRSRLWRVVAWVGVAAYLLTLYLCSVVPLDDPTMWRGGIVAYSLVSCLVIAGIVSGTGPLRAFSWGPIAAVGRMTYGLYLYHWPIYLWLTSERTGLDQVPLFGLRVAVTFVVAGISYRFIEQPFRTGAVLPGRRAAVLIGPAVAVCIVAATFATAGSGADDPWATLREDAAAPPAVAQDPVLDVLVVTDPVGEPIADHLERVTAEDDAVDVVRAGGFECGELVGAAPDRTCSLWRDRWPRLVSDHDPDVVFLFVDDWPSSDLERLAGPSDELPGLATELVGNGLDLLTAEGATVLWGTNPPGILDGDTRAARPFHAAMASLLQVRSDLRRTEYIATVPAAPDQEYLTTTTDVVLDGLRAHRRAADGAVPRIMVVGDSQAKSIGYGLERFVAESGSASVWNLAVPGCGFASDGTVRDLATDQPVEPDQVCKEVQSAWPAAVERFDPDLVLVLTSVRDVADRRLPGTDDFATIGEDEIDEYLLETYTDAVDALSAGGATVVWMRPPCVRFESPLGGGSAQPSAFEPERIERLNDELLPTLVTDRPDDVVLYELDELLCPDGRFLEDADGIEDLRPDGVHPSEEAALWVAEHIHRDLVGRPGG